MEAISKEYSRLASKLRSARAAERKEAATELVDFLNSRELLRSIDADREVIGKVHTGIWEMATSALAKYWANCKTTKSENKECAQNLQRLVNSFPGGEDSEKRPLVFHGSDLIAICLDGFATTSDDCFDSLMRLALRLVKVKGLARMDEIDKLWKLAIENLDSKKSIDDLHRRAHGHTRTQIGAELLLGCLRARDFHVKTDERMHLVWLCTLWISSLGSLERRGFLEADQHLIEVLIGFIRTNPEQAIIAFRTKTDGVMYGEIIVDSVIQAMEDRGVIREVVIHRLLHALGEAASRFAVSYRSDYLGSADTRWLKPRNILVNLENKADQLLRQDFASKYEIASKECHKAKTADEAFDMCWSGLIQSYSRTLGIFTFLLDHTQTPVEEGQISKLVIKCESDFHGKRLTTNLMVLISILSDHNVKCTASLEALVRLAVEFAFTQLEGFPRSESKTGLESFWALRLVRSISRISVTNPELWREVYTSLASKFLPMIHMHSPKLMLVRLMAMDLLGDIVQLCVSPSLVANSIVAFQAMSNLVPTATSLNVIGQKLFVESFAKLVSAALRVARTDIQRRVVSSQENNSEVEDVPDMTMREFLINWVLDLTAASFFPGLYGVLDGLVCDQATDASISESSALSDMLEAESALSFRVPPPTFPNIIRDGDGSNLVLNVISRMVSPRPDARPVTKSALIRLLHIAAQFGISDAVRIIISQLKSDLDLAFLGQDERLLLIEAIELLRSKGAREVQGLREKCLAWFAEQMGEEDAQSSEHRNKRLRQHEEEEEADELWESTPSSSTRPTSAASKSSDGVAHSTAGIKGPCMPLFGPCCLGDAIRLVGLTISLDSNLVETVQYLCHRVISLVGAPGANAFILLSIGDGFVSFLASELKRVEGHYIDDFLSCGLDAVIEIGMAHCDDSRVVEFVLKSLEVLTAACDGRVILDESSKCSLETQRWFLDSGLFLGMKKRDNGVALRNTMVGRVRHGWVMTTEQQCRFIKSFAAFIRIVPHAGRSFLSDVLIASLTKPDIDSRLRKVCVELSPWLVEQHDSPTDSFIRLLERILPRVVIDLLDRPATEEEKDEMFAGSSATPHSAASSPDKISSARSAASEVLNINEQALVRDFSLLLANVAVSIPAVMRMCVARLLLMASATRRKRGGLVNVQFFARVVGRLSRVLHFPSVRQMFASDADFYWSEFFSVHATDPNPFDAFPSSIFEFASVKAGLRATLPSVLGAVLLVDGSRESMTLLEHLARVLEPDDNVNPKTKVKMLLEGNRGSVVGSIFPLLFVSSKKRLAEAARTEVARILGKDSSSDLDIALEDMTAAAIRALQLLCHEEKAITRSHAESLLSSLSTSDGRDGTGERKQLIENVKLLNTVDIFLGLAVLAQEAGNRSAALARIAEVTRDVLRWHDLTWLASTDRTALLVLIQLLLNFLHRTHRGVSITASACLEELVKAMNQSKTPFEAELDVIRLGIADDALHEVAAPVKALMRNPGMETEKGFRITVQKLLGSFPSAGRQPGNLRVTPGLVLSLSAWSGESRCVFLLEQLAEALERLPKDGGGRLATQRGEEAAIYNLLNTLRPNGSNEEASVSENEGRAGSGDDPEDPELIMNLGDLLLELAGAGCPQRVRDLAGQCLTSMRSRFIQGFDQPRSSRALKPDDKHDPLAQMRAGLLAWTLKLVTHEDACVSSVAAHTLYSLLATQEGKEALGLVADQSIKRELESRWFNRGSSMNLGIGALAERLAGAAFTNPATLWELAEPNETYERWVCRVVSTMSQKGPDEYFRLISPLCALEHRLSTMVFPWLVFAQIKQTKIDLSLMFNTWLARIGEEEEAIMKIKRLLLTTLNFLRGRNIAEFVAVSTQVKGGSKMATRHSTSPVNRRSGDKTKLDYRYWFGALDVDLLTVARASISCGFAATTLICIEIYKELRQHGSLVTTTMDGLMRSLTERDESDTLALAAYEALGSREGLTGIDRTIGFDAFVESATHEGDWLSAAVGHDLATLRRWASPGGHQTMAIKGEAMALGRLGLVGAMSAVLNDRSSDEAFHDDLVLESSWRSRVLHWRDGIVESSSETFHGFMCATLKALASGDATAVKANSLECSRRLLDVANETESGDRLMATLARLTCVRYAVSLVGTPPVEIMANSNHHDARDEECFAARRAMLTAARMSWPSKILEEMETSQLVASAELARANGRAAEALFLLDQLSLKGKSSTFLVKVMAQKALAVWSKGDGETALRTAMECVRVLEAGGKQDREDSRLVLESMRILVGHWLARSSAVSSKHIKEEWLGKAVKELRGMTASVRRREGSVSSAEERILGEAHMSLGLLLDRQFRSLELRLASPEQKQIELVWDERQKEYASLEAHVKVPGIAPDRKKELNAKMHRLAREMAVDSVSRSSLHQNFGTLLDSAFENLVEALRRGATVANLLFRVVQLWFAHPEQTSLSEMMKRVFLSTSSPAPSSLLIPLAYQIVSRVGSVTKSSVFDDCLLAIVLKLARDHPFHVLPHVFALAHSGILPASRLSSTLSHKSERADKVLSEVSRTSAFHAKVVEGLRHVYLAFIALAYHPSGDKNSTKSTAQCREFVEHEKLFPKGFIPVPVVSLPLRADLNYEKADFPRLKRVKPEFKITDQGVNVPKIVDVETSHGNSVRLLVKGKDDLRQDAVMEQLLGFVSELLEGTKTRIRTYNVLPLTPEAGVIEWVLNTVPMGTYLYGGTTSLKRDEVLTCAHARHNPHDLSFLDAMVRMKESHEKLASSALDTRLDTYRQVLKLFRPALRHFFYERFGHNPVEWHQRKDAYTRSTAANSMVGMILGIGDRHSQNILIDEFTGEVVHIDFGVTFEQGKTLKTPETVPFRLTPDVIDGFGVSGVRGVFTRSCEQTLKVLRDNAEAILTICEVFVHDPLHRWSVNTNRHQNSQDQRNARTIQELEASHMLSRLRQKLQGMVDEDEPLSVEAQVKRVVQEASDEQNLSMLYYGWASFL